MEIKKLLLIAFMISGMTALIYEIVWSRQLQLIFGSTIYLNHAYLFVGPKAKSDGFRFSGRSKRPRWS